MEKVHYRPKPHQPWVRSASQKREWESPHHQLWLSMQSHHQWEPGRRADRPAAGYAMAAANPRGKAREGTFISSFAWCSLTCGLASSIWVGCVQTVPLLLTMCSRGVTYFFSLVPDNDYFHMQLHSTSSQLLTQLLFSLSYTLLQESKVPFTLVLADPRWTARLPARICTTATAKCNYPFFKGSIKEA